MKKLSAIEHKKAVIGEESGKIVKRQKKYTGTYLRPVRYRRRNPVAI